jgi:hypothetical protein
MNTKDEAGLWLAIHWFSRPSFQLTRIIVLLDLLRQ